MDCQQSQPAGQLFFVFVTVLHPFILLSPQPGNCCYAHPPFTNEEIEARERFGVLVVLCLTCFCGAVVKGIVGFTQLRAFLHTG